MIYTLALDLNGHLVEIKETFESKLELLKYLHKHYKSYKDLELYIIEYEDKEKLKNNIPEIGYHYTYNIDTYYSCEDGVYYEEHYHEIDQDTGTKEIGEVLLVNRDLLSQDLKDDGELIELAIKKWINCHYESSKSSKPIWLI